jgi:hypothetical protein
MEMVGESDASVFVFDEETSELHPGEPPSLAQILPFPASAARSASSGQSPMVRPETIKLIGSYLYVADPGAHKLFRVDTQSGSIEHIAGIGTAGDSGDGGLAIEAQLHSPSGIEAIGPSTLLVSDRGTHRIRALDLGTGIISAWAGTGLQGYAGDGGTAISALLDAPSGLLALTNGDVLIADTGNNRVRKVATVGGVISAIAGNGTAQFRSATGIATATPLFNPAALVGDGSERVWISTVGSHAVFELNLIDNTLRTLAGRAIAGYVGDFEPGQQSAMDRPVAMALATNGDLLVAEVGNNILRSYDFASTRIGTIFGDGTWPQTDEEMLLRGVPRSIFGIADLGSAGFVFSDPASGRLLRAIPNSVDLEVNIEDIDELQVGQAGSMTFRVRNGSDRAATAVVFGTSFRDIGAWTMTSIEPASHCTLDSSFALICSWSSIAPNTSIDVTLDFLVEDGVSFLLQAQASSIEPDSDPSNNELRETVTAVPQVFRDGFEG